MFDSITFLLNKNKFQYFKTINVSGNSNVLIFSEKKTTIFISRISKLNHILYMKKIKN